MFRDPASPAPAGSDPLLHTDAAAAAGAGPLCQRLFELQDQLHAERSNSQQRDLAVVKLVHDLRTPLNGVLGACQLLRGGAGGIAAEHDRWQALIESCAGHMLRLVDGILDQARLDAAHLRMAPASISLREEVQTTLAMVESRAQLKGLGLSLQVDNDVPNLVHADALRLRRILLNLLSNAINYTASGGVRLRIRTADAARLRVEVQDDGPGLDEAQHLEMFVRGALAEQQAPGTGIGLSVVRELVRLMGSELMVDSHPGKGTTIFFEWDALPPT